MGLLAGEKRKQKLGLDPNNITWAKDTNSVGQSMLKKMGWKEGAGLGANEDGRVVPVKAIMKSNTAGLGCSAKQADSWIAHGEEFDQILAALNASTSATSDNGAESPASGRNSPKEEMEGQRRFYGRYSRGNVKRTRTAEDLNCIFGRRKTQAPSEDVTKSKEEAVSEDSSNDSTDDKGVDKSHGVETVISTYSVQDYFAQKMKNLKKKKDEDSGDKMDLETNKQVDETQDVDSDPRDVEKQDFNSYVTSACSVKDYFSQKLKAKNEKLAIVDYERSADNEHNNCEKENLVSNNDCSNIDDDEAIKEELVDVKMKKKKKKKRKTDDDEVPTVESSPNVNDNADEDKTEKKKGKKRKCEDVEGEGDDSTSCVEETCVVEKSEKKKKKRRRTEVVEDSVMESTLDINDETDETCTEERTKKKKNKKKRKTEDVEINDDDDSNLDTNNETIEEKTEKRKKKKKKSKSGK